MSEESKAAVEAIINGCVDSEAGQLYLYTYLTEYRKSGLTYYYQDNNYLRIRNQIQILKDNLSTVYNDPEFLPLLIDIEYEEYYEDIADIINKLDEITLSDPHEAINTASPSLAELVAAIEQVGDVQDLTATDVQLVLTKTLDAAAPQRAVVSITVQAVNSVGDVIKSGSNTRAFSIVEPLTDADIAGLNEMIEALVRSLAIDTVHYETSDVLGLEAGTTLQSNAVITITYSPKEYTVRFVDEKGNEVGTTTFKYDLPTIILPACEEAGMQYRYDVCGTEIIVGSEAKSVTFTTEQIDSGEYAVIVRTTADVYRENVLDLVAELNKGAVNASMVSNQNITMAFIPMEDENGNLVLVFRISPDNLDHMSDYLQKVAEAITATDYSYIKIGNDFLREESLISLQAMINTVLYSGMSLDTLLGVIDENGHINEMTLPGATVIGADADGNISVSGGKRIKNANVLGGKLFETTMNFGVSRNDIGISAKLYVTLEDFGENTSDLKDARDMIRKVRNHGNITAHDGMLDIEVELPDRAYQAYLTAMIALGNTTFATLDEIDILPAKDLILDLVTYLVSDETITTATYENTADKVDYDLDLSEYNSLYNNVRKVLNTMLKNLTFANEQATSNSYASDLNFDLTEILDDLDLADTFRGMIKEADSGIEFGLKLTITNANDYEALVLDPGASGLDVVNYTRDLASVLPRIHKNTVVILLSDINGDIVAKQNMYLDLNGHMVNGNLKGEADLTVFDSALATRSGAGATGSITGNVTLIAGKYSTDVTPFVRKGFIVEDDGTVRNGYYYVEVEGDTINVHLTPEVDVLRSTDQTGYELLAADFGADVLLNYYMCSALTIGGNSIYDMHVNDLVRLYQRVEDEDANGILDCIDCAGITAFANDLLDKLTDFTALSESMKAGEAVFSYDLEYQPWSFELEHVTNGDYLTVNVLPNANISKSQTMNFFIDEDGDIAGMLEALGKVLTIDAEVELSDISYDFQHDNITITGGARVDVIVDMTSDPDYAIVVAVALANGTDDDAKREALIEGIKRWYESGYIMSDLKEAVENMTTAELVKAFDTDKAFTAMVADLGLTGIVEDSAADLYKTYESAIKAGFVLIDRIGNIKGGNTLIGSLEDGYGIYVKDAGNRDINRTEKIRDNYGVQITATIESVSLTVILFTEDVPFPIIVLNEEGEEIWHGSNLNEAFDQALDGYTIVVSDRVALEADVELDREVKLEGGEYVDFGNFLVYLTDAENSKFIIDMEAMDYVDTELEDYAVCEEEDGEGNYIYTLEEVITYKILVTNGDETLYAGDDLNEAFELATEGSLIEIFDDVALTADVELDRAVTVEGADYADFGEFSIILTSEDAELTIDRQITDTVVSSDETYYVEETEDDGNYVYTLERYDIVVTNGDEILYKGDDLGEAFASATDGSTITVYNEVVLEEDVELDRKVEVVGGEYIDFNGHTITLTDPEAELTIDAQITEIVKSDSEYSEVKETKSGSNYVYKLSALNPTISNPSIEKGDIIAAYKIDNTKKIIILDILDPESITDFRLSGNGITAKRLAELVNFTYENASTSQMSITVNNTKLSDSALVPTGAEIIVTASNPDSNVTAQTTYTIVILGDTNCNGRIDSGDAKLMLDHYFGTATLKEYALIAADVNCNGRVESGDAVKNSVKYNRPADYKSDLK